MKRILFLFISVLLMLTMMACNIVTKGDNLDTENIEVESIDYEIEKIVLSKGFQSLSPNVELLKKGSHLKLLASPGLLESSGITIDKITKSGNEINIHIKNLTDEEKQLATPQILVEINDPLIKKSDKINFNIISENYEPISLKLDKNQILSKIYSDFKIEPTSLPLVNLNRTKDSFVWDISFSNVLNTETPNFSLVNLDVSVDANTGEIIESIKDDISTYIDDGVLLDFISDKILLYKQHHIDKEDEYDSLWTYNIETGEKTNIYTSRYEIHSALFNPDSDHLSFIESDGNNSDLYIASLADEIAYKITPVNDSNSKLMKWSDNQLYFMDSNKTGSTLFEYDIDKNEFVAKLNLDKVVEDFDINKDEIIFVEHDKDLVNQNIYLTENGSDLKKIGSGFQATFLNDNYIAYLQNIEKEDKNTFQIYGKDGQTEHRDSEYSITNYFKLDDQNVLLSKKNSCNNDYILAKYNLVDKDIVPFASIQSDKIFYNSGKSRAYINLSPPVDMKEQSIIYSIDLDKVNIEYK